MTDPHSAFCSSHGPSIFERHESRKVKTQELDFNCLNDLVKKQWQIMRILSKQVALHGLSRCRSARLNFIYFF